MYTACSLVLEETVKLKKEEKWNRATETHIFMKYFWAIIPNKIEAWKESRYEFGLGRREKTDLKKSAVYLFIGYLPHKE